LIDRPGLEAVGSVDCVWIEVLHIAASLKTSKRNVREKLASHFIITLGVGQSDG